MNMRLPRSSMLDERQTSRSDIGCSSKVGKLGVVTMSEHLTTLASQLEDALSYVIIFGCLAAAFLC